MERQDPTAFFDEKHAAAYDQRYAKVAPLREALLLLTKAILADLPEQARILCVGAGTGSELISLAERFSHWRFTAVEPSAPMLDVCRRRMDECGIAPRCEFHGGYLETLPSSEPFDAATSLLVSQFLLAQPERIDFFRGIADRLRPGGYLVSADLASDINSATYDSLLEVWFRLMKTADLPADGIEKMRAAYGRDVAVLPAEQVGGLMESAGFEPPIPFLQTGLIHAWYTRRPVRS